MSILQSPVIINGFQLSTGTIAQKTVNSTNLRIVIDNAFIQKIRLNNIITQHPTTSGTPLNDNLARQAIAYQIEGILSSSTVNGALSVSNAVNFKSPFSYMSARIQQIQTAVMNPYIFTVNTPIVVYRSMGLLSCEIQQDYKSVNGIKITLTMQELLLAPSTVTQTFNNSNRDPINRGNQNG